MRFPFFSCGFCRYSVIRGLCQNTCICRANDRFSEIPGFLGVIGVEEMNGSPRQINLPGKNYRLFQQEQKKERFPLPLIDSFSTGRPKISLSRS